MPAGPSETGISQWLRRARRAEPEALEQLLESYRQYLRFLARTSIGKPLRGKADPSDLVQETLLKAHQHFEQFRGTTEAELASWLRQILTRNLADLLRRFRAAGARQVTRERSLEELLDGSALVAGGDTPSGDAQRRELRGVLADALAGLADDHREVLVLRSLEERSWDEVAQRMGRTAGAVRLLWARALKRLRPLIEARL